MLLRGFKRLLREAGLVKFLLEVVGDGGIDGVGILRVNLVSFQVYFQCKRWRGGVGSKDIKDFKVHSKLIRVFLSQQVPLPSLLMMKQRDGAITIDLINGERLRNLLKEHSLRITTRWLRGER